MAIYTRTGDKGETALFNGEKVSKTDLRIEVLGTIDELNSAIGVTIAELKINDPHFAKASRGKKGLMIKEELVRIQNDLLSIGSALANPQGQALRKINFEKKVRRFEDLIDEMTESLPLLKNFILPGGGKTGAMLHLSRAVCRRLERRIVELNNKARSASSGRVDGNIIVYFNRFSDLLFTMARFVNFKEKRKEVKWSSKK